MGGEVEMVTAQQIPFFGREQVQQWLWQLFAQEFAKLSPEGKEALKRTVVEIVRNPDRIQVVASNPTGDPEVEKVKDILLDNLINPLSQIVAAFQCQVKVFK
jgi:hypothetical protein